MDRMVGNLFSNIRRHTPQDAPVKVSLERSKDSFTLVVEDGGAGFENFPDKTRLAKRFSPERSADGTGLGLSIISSIVDRYEGSLTYSRSSLGGVKVEIVLPLSTPEISG
jgi:K+-sensing histidine kinase KdpD